MKRKNIIYYLSLAMLLGACTEANEIDNPSIENETTYGDQALSFGSSTDQVATKGWVIYDEESMATMGVYSYITAPNEVWGEDQSDNTVSGFLNEYSTTYPVSVSYDSTSDEWSYGSDVRYWPSDASLLHFYAWAPYGEISRTFDDDEQLPIFSFELDASAVNNEDLLWAPAKVNLQYEENSLSPGNFAFIDDNTYKASDDLNSDGFVNEGTVHFAFSHALSRITIYARVLVSNKVSIAEYDYFTDEQVAAFNSAYGTEYEVGDPIPYTGEDGAQSVDPTDIYAYERMGINGVTFYNVVGEATASYDPDATIPWEPSWLPYTTSTKRVTLTASQGNTLLDHENNIRNAVGQVPKVDENDAYTVDGTPDYTTFGNVMMTETDSDGTVINTHGIFLLPQTFSSGGDSPSSTIDMRVRHYDNTFISVLTAEDLLLEHEGSYLDYIYCLDENGTLAVIDFEKKILIAVQIEYENGEPDYYALDPYDMDDDADNDGLGANYYFTWNAAGDTVAARYYAATDEYGNADTSIYYLYDEDDNDLDMKTSYTEEELTAMGAILRYQCVKKDLVGTLYSSAPISLSGVFTSSDFLVDSEDYGLQAGQHAALYFTFDLTDGAEISVPMTVYARVLDWTDVEIEESVDDQLVIYCDTQTLSSASGTVYFYTKCQETIEIVSVEGENMTVTSPTTSYTVEGASDHVTHTVTYTGATASTATIEVTVEKSNGQQVTKYFTFDVTI